MLPISPRRLEELKQSPRMPSPDGVALEIARLAVDENVRVSRIVSLVQGDPALAGKLVHLANSAGLSGGRRFVAVNDAINRLGLRSVRAAALAMSLIAGKHVPRCDGFDYTRFWAHSLACAIAAKAIAARRRLAAPDEFFTLGLLSQIGRLAFASVFPDEYSVVLREASGKPPARLLQLERETFGIDHAQVSAAMLAEWLFPPAFIEMALHFGNPDALTLPADSPSLLGSQALSLASSFADLFVEDESKRPQVVGTLVELGRRMAVDSATLPALSDAIAAEWHEWGQLLNVATRPVAPLTSVDSATAASGSPPATPSAGPDDVAAAQGPGPHQVTPQAQPRTLQILVVDGDTSCGPTLESMLGTREGHTVTQVTGGKAAIDTIAATPPDIIVTALDLPDRNGSDLVRSLRATPSGRMYYVIAMLAANERGRLGEALASGVDEFVGKPLERDEVYARLRAAARIVGLEASLLQEDAELRKVTAELASARFRLDR